VLYIIQCSDAAASFKGLGWRSEAAGGPIIPQVSWIRTETELAQHKAFGCPVLLLKWSELYGIDCTRPLPPAGIDPGHEWTGSEFRTVVG
jgi:hypothetical protein